MEYEVDGGKLIRWETVLELLAVHPKVQRQGVGEALTRWGTRKADEKNVKVSSFSLAAMIGKNERGSVVFPSSRDGF